ncbi:hypothetical protein KKC59_04645 [bacterium]|nr:hypothetical protein [bacterium]
MPVSVLIIEDGTGKADANSYIDLAFSNQYFEDRLYSSKWNELSDDDKTRALLMSANILDTYVDWRGRRTNKDQVLVFPRYGLEDEGYAVLNNEIPIKIKKAQAELALFIVLEDRVADRGDIGIKEIQVESIKLVFDKEDFLQVVPDVVINYLKPFIYMGEILLERS